MAINIMRHVWLCCDCTNAACNADTSGVSEERAARIDAGLRDLGPISIYTDPKTGEGIRGECDDPCDCCGMENDYGTRTRFAILGEATDPIQTDPMAYIRAFQELLKQTPFTRDLAKECLARLIDYHVATGDDEGTHSMERQFRETCLTTIADRGVDIEWARGLADLALATDAIEFKRYFG